MAEVMEKDLQTPEAEPEKKSLKEKWKGLPKKKRRRIVR